MLLLFLPNVAIAYYILINESCSRRTLVKQWDVNMANSPPPLTTLQAQQVKAFYAVPEDKTLCGLLLALPLFHDVKAQAPQTKAALKRITDRVNTLVRYYPENVLREKRSITVNETQQALAQFAAGMQYVWEQDPCTIDIPVKIALTDNSPEPAMAYVTPHWLAGGKVEELEMTLTPQLIINSVLGNRMDAEMYLKSVGQEKTAPSITNAFLIGVEETKHISDLLHEDRFPEMRAKLDQATVDGLNTRRRAEEIEKATGPRKIWIPPAYDTDARIRRVAAKEVEKIRQNPMEVSAMDFIREHLSGINERSNAVSKAHQRMNAPGR